MPASGPGAGQTPQLAPLIAQALGPLAIPMTKLRALASAEAVETYLVGGVVRDALWALQACRPAGQVRDADVVVVGDAPALAQALVRSLPAELDINPRFGTATWRHKDYGTLDFSTARRERYAHPAALPDVSPTSSLQEDLQRRDFTINAIAFGLSGAQAEQLCDPLEGARDLAQQALVVLHSRSFIDDPTRLWRGARLAARMRLQWSQATAQLARAAATDHAQRGLTPARLGSELALAMAEPHPAQVLAELAALGLLEQLGLTDAARHTFERAGRDAAGLLAEAPGWLVPLPEPAAVYALLLRLVLPDEAPLAAAVQATGLVATTQRPHRQQRIATARNHAQADDAVEFAMAMGKLTPLERAAVWLEAAATNHAALASNYASDTWQVSSAIDADSLQAAGVAPSPAMARALVAAQRAALRGEDEAAQRSAAFAALVDAGASS